MQILIIDDEPVELFLAKKILNMEFKAEGFNTLPEALQWARTNSFNVLLCDYYLDKQLNASDVLRSLVDLKGKSFKSFVLTNFIDESKVTEMLSAGFDGVIEKPLSLEKFKKSVGLYP